MPDWERHSAPFCLYSAIATGSWLPIRPIPRNRSRGSKPLSPAKIRFMSSVRFWTRLRRATTSGQTSTRTRNWPLSRRTTRRYNRVQGGNWMPRSTARASTAYRTSRSFQARPIRPGISHSDCQDDMTIPYTSVSSSNSTAATGTPRRKSVSAKRCGLRI
jgi:hypothetical protein